MNVRWGRATKVVFRNALFFLFFVETSKSSVWGVLIGFSSFLFRILLFLLLSLFVRFFLGNKRLTDRALGHISSSKDRCYNNFSLRLAYSIDINDICSVFDINFTIIYYSLTVFTLGHWRVFLLHFLGRTQVHDLCECP